jgi:hypothetical protein
MKNAYNILIKNLKGRDHLGYLSVDGRIILEGFFLPEQELEENLLLKYSFME